MDIFYSLLGWIVIAVVTWLAVCFIYSWFELRRVRRECRRMAEQARHHRWLISELNKQIREFGDGFVDGDEWKRDL